MNNDIEVIQKDGLNEMIAHAFRLGTGDAGPMLYDPDGTVQHSGIILEMVGIEGHIHTGHARGTCGYMNRACLDQNPSAVTAACLAAGNDIFLKVSGLDEIDLPVACDGIDFYLRLLEIGCRNPWTLFLELCHHESATRGDHGTPEKIKRFPLEVSYMQERWSNLLEFDPVHHPISTLDAVGSGLALASPTGKPWQH